MKTKYTYIDVAEDVAAVIEHYGFELTASKIGISERQLFRIRRSGFATGATANMILVLSEALKGIGVSNERSIRFS